MDKLNCPKQRTLSSEELDTIWSWLHGGRDGEHFIGVHTAGLNDGIMVKDLDIKQSQKDFTPQQVEMLESLEVIYALEQ